MGLATCTSDFEKSNPSACEAAIQAADDAALSISDAAEALNDIANRIGPDGNMDNLSKGERALVSELQEKTGISDPTGAVLEASARASQAADVLLDDNTKIGKGTCGGGKNACMDRYGANLIIVTDTWINSGPTKQVSVIGHEGFHGNGIDDEDFAEFMECLTFGEICEQYNPAVRAGSN